MTDRQLKESLGHGEIHNQYVLVATEPILIDRSLNAIKEALKVEESFDVDRFSLPDATIEDILSKLYLTPFISKKRVVIVGNLEDVSERELEDFADTVNHGDSGNCLVLTYLISKGTKHYDNILKKLAAIFPKAECIIGIPSRNEIKKWIQSKIRRDRLGLDDSMVAYLEEEFRNDITGLKNEFDKIENYLEEVGSIQASEMKDLAKGLCDSDRYRVADAFIDGHPGTLAMFEELQPYIPTNAVMVDALTRRMINRVRKKVGTLQASRTSLQEILDQLIIMDRKIKTSSIFTRLLMELFILHNAGIFMNGASYGR
jgi:DNA polymerase III delta subunit